MKIQKIIAVLCIAVLFSIYGSMAGAGDSSSSTSTFSEAEALNLAQEWASRVSQADSAELEKLLHDKYTHIHATALVESKAQFLEAFKNGSRKYDPIKIEDPNVRVFGGSAVVTGRFNLKAFVRGKTIEGVNRFSLVLVKSVNGLQVVSFQATGIPPQK